MSDSIVFQVKTTPELTRADIAGLTALFHSVFGKPCPEDLFRRKFAGPRGTGSLHSLMFLEGEIIGAFSAIPVPYRFFGQELLFAITADLMIVRAHRKSLPRFRQLAEALYDALAQAGVAFVFCSLRDEIFQLHRKLSSWRAVGKLHYYAAPFRVPYLGPASALLHASIRAWNAFAPAAHTNFAIEKINDAAFSNWRYRIFPSGYRSVALRGGEAVYAVDLYYPIERLPSGIRLGLLLDVDPLTRQNFDDAVSEIRKLEPHLTALAWQGSLPFQPRDMLRVPPKYEKQAWTLGGRILAPTAVDDRIFDLAHWNINLSNGDLV